MVKATSVLALYELSLWFPCLLPAPRTFPTCITVLAPAPERRATRGARCSSPEAQDLQCSSQSVRFMVKERFSENRPLDLLDGAEHRGGTQVWSVW